MEPMYQMPNMNNEDFWNPIEVVFPLAVNAFKTWIDEYKKGVNWVKLFGKTTKFHDLPYEMQMGIMNRFFIEQFASKEEYSNSGKAEIYQNEMREALGELNKKLLKKRGIKQ